MGGPEKENCCSSCMDFLWKCDCNCCDSCYKEPPHRELQETGGWGSQEQVNTLSVKVGELQNLIEKLETEAEQQRKKLEEETRVKYEKLAMEGEQQRKKLEEKTRAQHEKLLKAFELEQQKRRELKQETIELRGTLEEQHREAKHQAGSEEELRGLLSCAEEEREAMREDIAYLKSCIERMSRSQAVTAQPQPSSLASEPESTKGWIVPQVLYDDGRVTPVLHQLLSQVDPDLEVVPIPSASITLKHAGRVLLPVVAASRVGSDITAAVAKAKLGPVAPIILIFHHLAGHNSRIGVATRDRLHDRTLVESAHAMVDAVFWEGRVYECAANVKAVEELKEIVRQM